MSPVVNFRETGRRFGHAEVFAAIGLLSFFVARFVPVLGIPFACPLRGLAGIPCATCGMTHAFVHLAHGAIGAAFAASPAGAVLAGVAWLFSVADFLRLLMGWPLPLPTPRTARVAAAVGVAVLLVNWAWLVVREVKA
jgi:hypothetical protein